MCTKQADYISFVPLQTFKILWNHILVVVKEHMFEYWDCLRFKNISQFFLESMEEESFSITQKFVQQWKRLILEESKEFEWKPYYKHDKIKLRKYIDEVK